MYTIHDFTVKNGCICIPEKELNRVADNLNAKVKRNPDDEYYKGQSHFVEKVIAAIHYPKAYLIDGQKSS